MKDHPCLSWAAKIIGMASGSLEVSPNLRVVANGNARIPLEREATVLRCGSRGPSLDGVWATTVGTEV